MEDQLQKISNGQSEEEKEMQEAKQKQETPKPQNPKTPIYEFWLKI